MNIEYLKIYDDKGPFKASFQFDLETTQYGPWSINASLFQKASGETWIAYPSRPYTNSDGAKKYFQLAFPTVENKPSFEADLMKSLMEKDSRMKKYFSQEDVKQTTYNEPAMDTLAF